MSSASDWLKLARVSNTPTVVSNSVAGAALVAGAPPAGDVAVVAVRDALFAAIGLLAAGEILLAILGWKPAVAGLALVALIVLYDAWHKGNALSPVLMAACRAMVYVVAGLAVAGALNGELWGAAALLLLYVVGLTQVAKAEGAGIAARWPVAAVLAPAVYWAKELPDAAVALLIVAFGVWVGYALWLVLARRRIGHGVVALIAGIAVYDALVVAGAGGGTVAVLVCAAAFAVTIALQTKIAGT
jgi:4-hydroxybenzoate polyprenyltransferase